MGVFDQFHIYLSDEAFTNLVNKARVSGHVRSPIRARGLGNYMVGLIRTNLLPDHWEDTRPTYASKGDLMRLEAGRLPIWDNEYPTRNRCISFSEKAQAYTKWLANQKGIIHISAFWEAVGLGWLTPKNPPQVPKWKGPSRKKVNEFDW